MSAIRKPDRSTVRFKLAMYGLGGSGKSFSSLLLARGLVGPEGRILVIHTEARAIDMHVEVTDFDVLDIEAPFEVPKFLAAIQLAAKEGYNCAIIDSLSPEWSGKGGLLELAEGQKTQSGRPRQGAGKWIGPKALHKDLLQMMMYSPLDLIATFWAKPDTKHFEKANPDGSKELTISVEGYKADTERNSEYAFDVYWELQGDHRAKVIKDRTQLFSTQPERLTAKAGERLAEWREQAPQAAEQTLEPSAEEPAGKVYQDKSIRAMLSELGIPEKDHVATIRKKIGTLDPNAEETIEKVYGWLSGKLNEREAANAT